MRSVVSGVLIVTTPLHSGIFLMAFWEKTGLNDATPLERERMDFMVGITDISTVWENMAKAHRVDRLHLLERERERNGARCCLYLFRYFVLFTFRVSQVWYIGLYFCGLCNAFCNRLGRVRFPWQSHTSPTPVNQLELRHASPENTSIVTPGSN